jgi:hypothetical protein
LAKRWRNSIFARLKIDELKGRLTPLAGAALMAELDPFLPPTEQN